MPHKLNEKHLSNCTLHTQNELIILTIRLTLCHIYKQMMKRNKKGTLN